MVKSWSLVEEILNFKFLVFNKIKNEHKKVNERRRIVVARFFAKRYDEKFGVVLRQRFGNERHTFMAFLAYSSNGTEG